MKLEKLEISKGNFSTESKFFFRSWIEEKEGRRKRDMDTHELGDVLEGD